MSNIWIANHLNTRQNKVVSCGLFLLFLFAFLSIWVTLARKFINEKRTRAGYFFRLIPKSVCHYGVWLFCERTRTCKKFHRTTVDVSIYRQSSVKIQPINFWSSKHQNKQHRWTVTLHLPIHWERLVYRL